MYFPLAPVGEGVVIMWGLIGGINTPHSAALASLSH